MEYFKFSQIPQEYKNVTPDFYSVLKAFPVKKELVTWATYGEWKLYTYSNDSFQVSLPAKPEVTLGSYRTAQYNQYNVSINDGATYSVAVGDTKLTFVPSIEQEAELALLTRTGTEVNTQKLISIKNITVSGYAGYDTLILNNQIGEHKIFIRKRGVYALSLGKYYEMTVGYFDDQCQIENCEKFFDSFSIIK